MTDTTITKTNVVELTPKQLATLQRREGVINHFLTEKGVADQTVEVEGEEVTIPGFMAIQGAFATENRLYTKPPARARWPHKAIIGEWKGEELYLYNLKSPLGKQTLQAAQALNIPIILPKVTEAVQVEPVVAESVDTETGEIAAEPEAPAPRKSRTVKARKQRSEPVEITDIDSVVIPSES